MFHRKVQNKICILGQDVLYPRYVQLYTKKRLCYRTEQNETGRLINTIYMNTYTLLSHY